MTEEKIKNLQERLIDLAKSRCHRDIYLTNDQFLGMGGIILKRKILGFFGGHEVRTVEKLSDIFEELGIYSKPESENFFNGLGTFELTCEYMGIYFGEVFNKEGKKAYNLWEYATGGRD